MGALSVKIGSRLRRRAMPGFPGYLIGVILRLCIYLANLELYHVQHVVVVGVEGLPLVPPRLAAGGLGSQASSGGRHHPSSLLGTGN